MSRPLSVIVVGAGIVGVSAAEWLRRDGHRVTLIDRVRPGDPAQTSFGNAGILAASSIVPIPAPGLAARIPGLLLSRDSPLFLRWRYLPRFAPWLLRFLSHGRLETVERIARSLAMLTADSTDEHLRLAAGTGADQFVRRSPLAYLYPDQRSYDADRFGKDLRERNGFAARTLSRADLLELDPALSDRYRRGALYDAHGYVTDPGAYVAALASYFQREGGTVLRSEVRDIAPIANCRAAVETDRGRIEADRALVAAGIWSSPWLSKLGHEPAMETERGYHLYLRGARPVPPIPYLLADARVAVTPMRDGVRFAGLVEFASLEAGPSAQPIAFLRRVAKRTYSDLNWDAEETWMGNRPSTIDSLPVLGPAPNAPGIHFAFGTQHVGLTCGPKLGRLAAELVTDRRSNLDLSEFRVGRFDAGSIRRIRDSGNADN